MKKKVYLIKKSNITDGLIETDTEVYCTEQERDRAWQILTHEHNEMIRDCYCDEDHRDLNDLDEDEYHYEWDQNHLEFWSKSDPEMHTDYYDKGEDTIEISNKVYEVLVDSIDDNGFNFIESTLYYNKEDAITHFNKTIEDFEKDCLSSYDPEYYVIDRDENIYSWYAEGCYSENHFDVTLKEKEVK